jgi:hypothetical protein
VTLPLQLPPSRLTVTIVLLASLVLGAVPAQSEDVLTYHYNNARTGLNASETTLTLSNVNSTTFGKLFTVSVDGKVDAQPLYLSTVPIQGSGTHNLLIVATENDSVYAFDADSGSPIWHSVLLKTGETASDDRGCGQITPEIGITATPVISRPKGSNGVIYAVAMSKDSSGNYYQRLHALDATTGKEVNRGPVEITAKYPGSGDGSSGGYVIFDPGQYAERASLLIVGNNVYLAWTSHCDVRPYTGWIMGYNIDNLAQVSVLDITPNGHQASIWGSGTGLTADNSGNIFVLAANGIFDTSLNSSGFPVNGDYGNAFLRLSTSGGLAVADYFEMYNGPTESDEDMDLGSGGNILLPNMTDSSGNTWQLSAGAGKDTNLYLVNRNNLGKYNSTANSIYQELPGALPGGMWSMPAYYDGRLYYGNTGHVISAFQFKNAELETTPVAQTNNAFRYPGATPSISSNQSQNGILWAVENTTNAVLYAYNATTLQMIYNSEQAPNQRDQFGGGNKFITPVIINGKVYVGTTTGVGVFGLLSDPQK